LSLRRPLTWNKT